MRMLIISKKDFEQFRQETNERLDRIEKILLGQTAESRQLAEGVRESSRRLIIEINRSIREIGRMTQKEGD